LIDCCAMTAATVTIPELSDIDYRKLISKPLIRVSLIYSPFSLP